MDASSLSIPLALLVCAAGAKWVHGCVRAWMRRRRLAAVAARRRAVRDAEDFSDVDFSTGLTAEEEERVAFMSAMELVDAMNAGTYTSRQVVAVYCKRCRCARLARVRPPGCHPHACARARAAASATATSS